MIEGLKNALCWVAPILHWSMMVIILMVILTGLWFGLKLEIGVKGSAFYFQFWTVPLRDLVNK